VTKGGGITVTVLMTSIDAKNRVADGLNSGCLEVEVKGLELTVLGLDLIDPFRD
jgi:hypothetical protein